MIVTVYRARPVTADITVFDIGAYLDRAGWELLQLGDRCDAALGEFSAAKWSKRGHIFWLRGDGDVAYLEHRLRAIANVEGRDPADVLADVAGHPPLDRDTAIRRARGEDEKAAAMLRVTETAAELEQAMRALEAVGGR